MYVASECNPADGPSRGIYSSVKLLLPVLPITEALQPFIVDSNNLHVGADNHSADRVQPDTTERSVNDHSIRNHNEEVERDNDSLYLIRQRQQQDCQ